MITQRKIQITLALFISSIFLFQNCAIIIRGTSQKIPVTSNPIGAKIMVDGIEIGNTPIELKLKRKKSHLIRIEKQGYNPFEIRITRKSSSSLSIFGNLVLGGNIGSFLGFLLVGYGGEFGEKSWVFPIGLVLGWASAIAVDFISGANYNLILDNLILTLTKKERNVQLNFIQIDAEQFQNIKWIRIRCADNGKGEIVNIN